MFKFIKNPFAPRRNNARKAAPKRNNSTLKRLRGIVAAKSGARHWLGRARKRINNRGRPAAPIPRSYNNQYLVMLPNGRIVPNSMARGRSVYGNNNYRSNRMGGMWN